MAEAAEGPISGTGSEIHPAAAAWLGTMPPSLQRVATGLQLIYLCIVVELVMVIAMVLVVFGVASKLPQVAAVILLVNSWVAIGVSIVSIVGTLLCLATPEESGAANYIRASVVFLSFNAAATLGVLITKNVPQVLQEISQPAQIVSYILFVLFLRKLALFLGRVDLARRARNVLIGGVVLLALMFIPLLISRWFMGPGTIGRGIFTIVLLAATLCTFLYVVVKYANLLSALGRVIRNAGELNAL